MYDGRGWGDVAALPGGDEFNRRVEKLPDNRRHLDVHANHLVGLNDLDAGIVTGEALVALGLAADERSWRARLEASEAAGVTEVVFQPAGPDIERELRAFAHMASVLQAA
jgi:5,10-methylenetetrahydromethanopterin reductase